MTGWIEADPDTFDIHIHQTMVRLQIENCGFFYKNIANLSKYRLEKLMDINSLMHLQATLNNEALPPNNTDRVETAVDFEIEQIFHDKTSKAKSLRNTVVREILIDQTST